MRPPIYWKLILQQMLRIGYFSLPVVGLTAFFTGAVLCLQIFIGGSRYGAESFVPQIVVLGITRELGPVIAGLMVAGRVSAAIAAELGTMRVTEQIDALTTLSTNPMKYLVTPRLIAGVLSMPILVAIADSIGVFGGYIVATRTLNFNGAVYVKNTANFVTAGGCGFRTGEGGGVRVHHRADGLLQRLQFQGRSARRWQRHDECGRVGFHSHSRGELSSHFHFLCQMTACSQNRTSRREEAVRAEDRARRDESCQSIPATRL